MIHADPPIEHAHASSGPRRVRLRASWVALALLGAVLVAALVAVRLAVQHARVQRADVPTFISRGLGSATAAAPVRMPARGVRVRLDVRGYRVDAGRATVSVAALHAGHAAWSQRAHGVTRATPFGYESIVVGPQRTEELLTVRKHEGKRLWRWRIDAPARPVLGRDGSVAFARGGGMTGMRIAPVQILDADGGSITPRSARWRVRRAHAGSWWLELRLDDSKLSTPYVIDPATDYPSPLYLSSTASTDAGSWRLVTAAPAAANVATSNTPGANATGYFAFRPGSATTTATTPSATPTGNGFVQDLAGGTAFAAGSWTFAVKTQIPSTGIVAGSAILSIGVWKGTISKQGNFSATQTILSPTDDPAAQNIRAALTQTTNVTYSLPAFVLSSTERLYVEIWRRQTGGINSATAADRQLQLVVNDGVSRITHPAADDTPPTNSFSVVNPTGGVYFTNPGGASGTVFVRGSAVGSFQLHDAAADTGSGVKQVTYPALSTGGWTHAAQTVTTAPAYQSSTYSWAVGANSPGGQAIVATDNAGNASSGTPLTLTNDSTAPTTPSATLTGSPAWTRTPSVDLTLTDGTDAGSGLDPAARVIQRDETALVNGVCGTFPSTWNVAVSDPDTTVVNGKCYRYRVVEADRVGNQATSTPSATAKVDLQAPTQPALGVGSLTNASATNSTVYYRPGVSGSFAISANSTDAESGVASYAFPTPATWTVTGTGANRTYAWSGTPTPPGTLGVHATDGAGNTSLDATFTPTPDSAAPTTTDDAASIGTAWNAAAQTVTLTPSDPLSGVSATYYTTNGSTPTTGSPQGTSISLTADGTYTIKYFSVDKVGNLEPVKTAGATIRVDGTPPSVTLASLPAAIRNGQVLTASASDPTSGVASLTYLYCNPSPCTPTTVLGTSTTGPGYAVTWSAEPADGSYDVAVRAMDNAGNVVTSAKQTVVIDNTTPDTSITSHPSAISTDGRPTFSFTATEPGVTFQCKVDAGAFAACTSPSTFTLADGAHTIAVRAADAAGNVDATPDSFAWTIDTTAPTTTITSRPAAIVNDSTASFSFTANDSAATFECKLDGGSFAACTSPTSYTGLAEGSHTFTVRSIDSAGNADPSPKVASWSIDTNAPDTTITAHPASVSTSAGATFSVTSSEPGSTFECALDGGAFAACSSPITYPNLADGDHTFAVHAIDGAGNTDPSPDTFSWTIDSLAPDTSIISHPNDPSNDYAPSFAFTSTEPGATYRCKLDGGSFSACTSPQAYTSLSDGAHTFAVQASDPAGNVDASPATFGWSIDTVVPDISITSQPANPSNDWAPTFAFSSAKTTATFECKLDDAAFSSCASPYGFAELPDGEHTFAVHAEDAAGNTSDDAAYTWTLDTTGVSAAADEIHYTFESATSVAFDWRGSPIDIRYGLTKSYGSTAIAHAPDIMPFSSPGPFREVELAGLQPGATYHYSIGGSRDHTFTTAPTDTFRFDVIADVGSSFISSRMAEVQNQVAADLPSFVLLPGDLTYGNVNGQAAVDQHFNDVMAWSLTAAYMPAWGNHEYETPATDDLRNYKGRFKLPNAQGIPSAPAQGCCGEDWGWFDAGGVRFIAYPERYRTSSMSEWQSAVDPIFAQAQADPNIHFIVTFGHEPPYSTGFHPGVQDVANVLGSFGDRYPKYVLNLNGHSHDYERYVPIHGVTNITSGGATTLEPPWTSSDPKQAFRAMHIEHLRVDVGSDGIRIEAICGPATQQDDTTCAEGSVLDSYTIGTPAPPPALAPVLYVDNNNPVCSDTGLGTQDEPFCKISTAASRVNPGQTIEVASGIYPETVTVPTSATEAAPIRFRTAPGASVLVTGGANGFTISNKSWISVNGFSISNTAGPGISVQNSSDITITNNHVIDAGEPVSGHAKSGIFLNTVRDSIVSGNTTDHNSSYGIYLAGSTRNDISHNTTFSNAQEFQRAAAGIRLYSSTQNTVERNITHDNEDSGIESFTNSNDNLIVNNVSYNNGDHGIDNYGSTGQRLIGNTVYHNFTAGINVEGGSTGATVANNVSVDNGIGSPRTRSDIRVENGSTAGTTLDYDLAYLTTPDVLFVWSSVPYNTLASFRAASGQEAHGINADPKFVDLANYNFHLTSRSPAVDSANSGASGEPGADSVGTGRVDDPATVDTGIGPRPYDDRGALELPSAPLDHITATPSAPSVAAGSSLRIDVTGFDAIGGSFGDVSGSSTYDIAPDGSCTQNVCTATKSGPHAVTATDGEKTSVASFTVTPASLDHIDLTPAVATTTALAPQAYTAVGRDVYGNSLGDITSTVTLSIAPNGSCSGASCTAPLAGAHTVTATKSAKTGTATLQVTASALDHIVIAPSSASIAAGATQPYTAQGFDAAGNSLGDVTAGTTFSIGPDGSCTGNVCTAAVARAHTVTGNDGGK
ncbi:MAG: OmpL47-type beta-barrel domain-containing protein, partial [Gaiellaceae bacterium]